MGAALGSFSGGGLGFGVTFSLRDGFSAVSERIQGRFAQMDANVSAQADRINASFGKVQAGIAMIGAGVGLLAPIAVGIENASDYAENLNKLSVAFGEYAGKVQTFTDSALVNYGIDKIRASDMASLFGDMSTGMGFSQDKAADLSTQLVALAGDLSSFKNISQEMSQTALKSIFTGETESLKNLGIVMTQANLEAFAASKGITKSIKDMSQQEAVMLRFNYVMAMSKNAIGDFARTSDGYANSKRKFEGSIKELSATLGQIFMPIVAKTFGTLANWAAWLSRSEFGQFAMKIVGIGIAFVALGVIIVGLKMLFVALGGVIWTALAPMLPIIATIAAIIAVVVMLNKLLNSSQPILFAFGVAVMFAFGMFGILVGAVIIIIRAMREFNSYFNEYVSDPLKKPIPPTGIVGFLVKLGGVVRAIIEIFKTAGEGGWSMSKNMEDALQSMGILPMVVAIGTWIVRLKEFFLGVKLGMKEAWTVAKSVFSAIASAFAPAEKMLDKLGLSMARNTSSMEKWKYYGKLAGYAIAAVLAIVVIALGAVAVSAIIAGISMLLAWLPTIIVMGLVVAAIWLIYEGIMWLIDAFAWLWQKIVEGWDWAKTALSEFWAWLSSLPEAAYNAGIGFVKSLWDGMKSMWSSFKDWLVKSVNDIPVLGAAIQFGGEMINGAVDLMSGNGGGNGLTPAYAGAGGAINGTGSISAPSSSNYSDIGSNYSQNKAQAYNNQPTVVSNNTSTVGTVIIKNELDGNLISEHLVDKMADKQAFDDARK